MSLDPPPTIAPLTQQPQSQLTSDWTRWFLALWGTVTAQPLVLGTRINLTNQNASIATTPFPLPAINGGICRISWYVRVTTTDPVSFSVTVTVRYSESGLPFTMSGPAVTTATPQSGVFVIVSDQASAISYSVAYTSNTPGLAKFRVAMAVEQV